MTDLLKGVKGFKYPDPNKKWQPEDVPYCESVDFEEVHVEELDIKRARSFRADLLHKLNICIRAFRTITATAKELRVHRCQVSRWLHCHTRPAPLALEVLDNRYQLAIEMLCAKKRKSLRNSRRDNATRKRKLQASFLV